MKIIMALFTLLVLAVPSFKVHANNMETSVTDEVVLISTEIGNYVLAKDLEGLMKYVPEGGVYFIDDHYTKAEVRTLLYNKDSWLYKHLFFEDKSVFRKFGNKPVEVEAVFKRDNNAVRVRYGTGTDKGGSPVDNCLFKIDGLWYFDGIFYCE